MRDGISIDTDHIEPDRCIFNAYFLLIQVKSAVFEICRIFARVTASKASPLLPFARYLTSMNTIHMLSRAIRSISPCRTR